MQLIYARPEAFALARANPALFATLARINALSMIREAGSGHIGSSFSSLDIITWLHLKVMGEHDVYFSSKGHDVPGLYALLVGLGRLPFAAVHRLRRLGGLPGHPDIETPGIAFSTGALGMGISKAKGLVHAWRRTGKARRVFVLLGDGELQEGQIWEALAGAARDRLAELTVIVDRNGLQSDGPVESVLPEGDIERKFADFGWASARADGHDPTALDAALTRLDATGGQPRVIIADTVKGAGVSFMEGQALYHSGAPAPAAYAKAAGELLDRAQALAQEARIALPGYHRVTCASPARRRRKTLVEVYGKTLLEAAAARPNLVSLDADLLTDMGLAPFRARYPERFIECGIAEQDMVSMASGLARGGLLPVVHSFATFLTQRASDQIYNAASERLRIVYVGALAGLVPADPGPSHQGIRDIAAMASIPGLIALEPAAAADVAPLLAWCLDQAPGPVYLRLTSMPAADIPALGVVSPGRGTVIREGRDVVVFGAGPVLLTEALGAAARLAQDGVQLRVVNLPWLNTVDENWLAVVVAGTSLVVTLDNHVAWGGQGQMIRAAAPLHRCLTIALEGWPQSGTDRELLAAHGVDATSLAGRIGAALKQGSQPP